MGSKARNQAGNTATWQPARRPSQPRGYKFRSPFTISTTLGMVGSTVCQYTLSLLLTTACGFDSRHALRPMHRLFTFVNREGTSLILVEFGQPQSV